MEIALKLVYQVAILFLMMLPGVVMRRAKLCCEHFAKGLSGLVVCFEQEVNAIPVTKVVAASRSAVSLVCFIIVLLFKNHVGYPL